MSDENLSQEFRFKNIDKAKNYFIEEINKNELMSKVCRVLNYIELLYLVFL